MHATEEHHPSAHTAALEALSARLNPDLTADLVCDGLVLMVRNPAAPVLRTVAVIAHGQYAVEIGQGEPPVTLAPVADPDVAAARVNRMLATVNQ